MTSWSTSKLVLAFLLAGAVVAGSRPSLAAPRAEPISRSPYIGAIAVEATSGEVLFEADADSPGYPASVVKLMNLLLVLEAVQQGTLRLDDPVTVTAEAARTGGSQVYLKEGESFTVDELLYALMVQSANDAATALAIHLAGSKAAFIERMNRRALDLGLIATRFSSVHGLPPGPGQAFDQSTARDLAILARKVLQSPDTLRYAATRERGFREGKFSMRTHNHLLGNLAGCDGLKTGYIRAGGFSIAATAERDGRRVVVVVLGSRDRKERDRQAAALVERAFRQLAAPTPALPLVPAGLPRPAGATPEPPGPTSALAPPAPAPLAPVPPPADQPGEPGRTPTPAAAPPDGPGAGAVAGGPATAGAQPLVALEPASREWVWGGAGLLGGLVLGYLLFGRRRER